MSSLSHMSQSIFTLPSFLENTFAGYRILDLIWLSSALNYLQSESTYPLCFYLPVFNLHFFHLF